MSEFQTIADRVEIEALRGEFTDAAMMRDYDRLASLFIPDGALRMPNIPAELAGQPAAEERTRREQSRQRGTARTTTTPGPFTPTKVSLP